MGTTPKSVFKIKKWAFEHCVQLRFIIIPEGRTPRDEDPGDTDPGDNSIYIEGEAFFECDSLDDANRKNIVERFGNKVFETAK